MSIFQGTFTATPVANLHVGDRVQWFTETGTVLDVQVGPKVVDLRLSTTNRIRPISPSLDRSFVLMVQRPEGS